MADIILTFAELRKLFYDLTVAMVDSETQVRMSWPTGGAPAFDINDKMAFIRIADVASTYHVPQELKYEQIGSPEEGNMQVHYTRTLRITWVLYGSNSWDDGVSLRTKIFYQTNHDILARQKIYLVPSFDPPKRVPELFEGLWYERVDLTMDFYEKILINYAVPSILTVPLVVKGDSGTIHNGKITESTIVREGGLIINR
jgi:hypothetical protein